MSERITAHNSRYEKEVISLPVGTDDQSFLFEAFDDEIVFVVFATPSMRQLIDTYG